MSMQKIKKTKEKNVLDWQDKELGDESDKIKSKRERSLESLHETIKTNADFKHLTNNAGKGQKIGYED